jgi:hypothetical protein
MVHSGYSRIPNFLIEPDAINAWKAGLADLQKVYDADRSRDDISALIDALKEKLAMQQAVAINSNFLLLQY